MDSNTALFTFMLSTPANVNSVNLVGSWDNFTKRYSMEKDVRKGRGQWKGCHSFQNIICDGDLNTRGRKRDGGLKMGGKYWYYYELDGDTEAHNPAQPSTNTCPFLPGQPINILEVPTEIESDRERSRSRSNTPVQRTMNPADKYTQPRPAPLPRLPRLSTSPASLARRRDPSASASPLSAVSPWSSRSSGHNSPISAASVSSIARHLPFSRRPSVAESGTTKSPARSNSFRGAFALINGTEPDAENTEKKELEISNPVLISRSDEGRYCIPLSAISRRNSSASPIPLPNSSSRIPSIITTSVTRPSTAPESPRSQSPLKAHPVMLPVPSSNVEARSRDPSPLRNPIVLSPFTPNFQSVVSNEDRPLPPLPVEIAEEEDDDVDDFNFESQVVPEEEVITITALAPPPSRKRSSGDSASLAPASPTSFGSSSRRSLVPKPLNIQRRSLDIASQEPGSHFSVWSTSTVPSSPTSQYTTDSPTSPCFSSITESSSVPQSPYEPATPTAGHFVEEDPSDVYRNNESSKIDEEGSAFGGLRLDTGDSKRKAACFGLSSFQSYSLPDEESNSQDTLRKMSTPGLIEQSDSTTFGVSTVGQQISALEELLNDLGYLGDAIN